MSEKEIDSFVEDLLETESLQKYMERTEFLNFTQAHMAPEISQKEIQ